MSDAIELSEEQKKEVLLFFKAKREQQAKDLAITDEIIQKLENKNNNHTVEAKQAEVDRGRGVAVPLKYKIDEILKPADTPLTARQIMNGLIKQNPGEYTNEEDRLRKTVASALSQNSKDQNDRYLKTIKMGLSYYSLNKEYKEKE